MISVTATPLDMANADLEEAADLLPAVYTMHAHLEAWYIIRHEDGQVACAIFSVELGETHSKLCMAASGL